MIGVANSLNSKRHITLLALGLLALMSFSNVPQLAAAQTSPSNNPGPTSLPLLPNAVGCYQLTSNLTSTSWQSTPCLSSELASAVPKPTEGGSYGVEGVGGAGGIANGAYEQVAFSTFSGESDATYGSNDWSIQLNTNFFTIGSTTYWVQFTEQNYPTYLTFFGYATFCIWQVDVTTQSYPNKCVSTSIQSLSSSSSPTVTGYLSSSGGINYLNGEYCENSTTCWAVKNTDNNGLTGNWSDSTGTILGLGNGSTADFTHPTSLSTEIILLASSSFSGYKEDTVTTAEMNNLGLGTVSFSCNSDSCTTTSPSSN